MSGPAPGRSPSLRLRNHVQLIDLQSFHDLLPARRPANEHATGTLPPEPEMQAPVVLAAEAAAAVHHLALPHVAEFDRHLRPDRAAIAARAHQLQLYPVHAFRR